MKDILRQLGGATAIQKMSNASRGVGDGDGPSEADDAATQRREFAEDVVRLRSRFLQQGRGFVNPRSNFM